VSSPLPEPIFFGPNERSCAGWLHRTAKASRSGVVICSPLGYEAICAHRSVRRFAEAFAEAGAPTLRFDYDGTGDSAGDDTDAGRLLAWERSTQAAVRALRELCGVERVWLVGIRLGALIATLAATNDPTIAGLIAIAPVVTGRTYLRELVARQMTLELEAPPPSKGLSAPREGDQEALGFAITAETRSSLMEINLAKRKDKLGQAYAQPFEMLVLDRDDLPGADKWVEHLLVQGTKVETRRVPGYPEMMLDPHKAIVPEQMVSEARAWLSPRLEAAQREGVSPSSVSTEGRPEPRTRGEFEGVIETPVFVDKAALVFGVLSRAESAPPTGKALLLLNAGAISHVGPNRLHVRLARQWALAGHEVLRLDISGLGESRTRPNQAENVVYSDHAMDDIRAAVAFCRRRGAREVHAVGLCSGAYHAIKGAIDDPTISGYVAINPLTFRPPPPGPIEFPSSRVAREAARYRQAAGDLEKWKKLVRGQVKVKAVVHTLSRHAAARARKYLREAARKLRLSWNDDVGAELEKLARRQVEQHFVFASNDPGNELLLDEAGSVVRTLQQQGRLTIDLIEGPDHTFTALWTHASLVDVLTAAIARPTAQRARPPSRMASEM